MHRSSVLYAVVLLATAATVRAEEPAMAAPADNLQARAVDLAADAAATPGETAKAGDKKLLGISILGNQDAPKALVLVPWKSSQLGATQDLDRGLDDSRGPVDRDVFLRELAYYEIREAAP